MFAIFQALEELCTCSRCCQDALSHRLCVDFVTFTSNLSRGGQRCAAWALLTVSHVTGVLCLFSLPLGSSQSISVAQNCRGLMMAQTVKRLPTMRETQVQSRVMKILWRRKWQPTPVPLPGKPHGWRSVIGYSPWGCRVRHDFTFTFNAPQKKT